jgi:hypothetical protein
VGCRRALVVCMLAVLCAAAPASASLMFYQNINVTGSGHGTVTEILGFPNTIDDITVSGCVKLTTSGTTAFGGPCPSAQYTFGSDQIQSGGNSSQIVRAGNVFSTMTPFSLAIVYDPSQRDAIQVDRLVLTFYNLANQPFYSAALPSPVNFPDGGTGSGGSGFTFGLDWDQAVAVQNALGPSLTFADVRLGLGAEVSGHDSHSYFFVANVDNLVQTPEPATYVLIGSALLGLGWLARRKRT